MSADFSADTPPEPAAPASAPPDIKAEPTADAPTFPAQKRRHRKPEDTDDDELVDEDDADLLLRAMLKSVLRRKRRREPEDAPRAAINRFPPHADVAVPDVAAPRGTPDGPAAAGVRSRPGEDGIPGPEATVSGALPKFKPRTLADSADPTLTWGENRGAPIRRFVAFFAVVALVLVAYLLGRNGAIGTNENADEASPDGPRTRWHAADSDVWAQALAADRAGDPDTALRLTDDLARHVKLPPTMRAYRATLNTRLEHVNKVEADLTPLLDPDTPPDVSATINAARAFNFVRCKRLDLAIGCFAAVAVADPSDVSNLLHWGETLRHQGNLAEATAKFQEALALLPITSSPYAEAQREYVAYEQRLSQVEAGREADLKPELDRRSNLPATSGYWLLTAAAVSLQKGDVPSAIAALQKARAAFSPEQFSVLLRDYFFRSFAYHPEMNAFLAPISPTQRRANRLSMDYFVDP